MTLYELLGLALSVTALAVSTLSIAWKVSMPSSTKLDAELADLRDAVSTALEIATKARAREAMRSHRAKNSQSPDPQASPEEWKRAMRAKLHGNIHKLNLE